MTVAGCDERLEWRPGAGAFSFVALVLSALALASAAAQTPPWVRTHWFANDTGPLDRGIGVVRFAESRLQDTITLHRDAAAASPLVGRLIHVQDGIPSPYAVETRDTVRPNLLEYDYEIAGLPIDTVLGSGWVRVVYAFDLSRRPLYAWVRTAPDSSGIVLWTRQLLERGLFFDTGHEPAFFDRPAGAATAFPLHTTPPDYVMHPLRTRGAWMQVRVARSPDDCGAEGADSTHQTVLWIRYLDDRGRPTVWYAPRGC